MKLLVKSFILILYDFKTKEHLNSVNENFKNLGHLVLKLDSATEAALPGDVSCKYDKKPVIEIGDRLEITQ